MIKRRLGLMCIAVAVASGSTALAQTVPLMPGYYEVMTTLMPSGTQDSRDRCVTAEHLVEPEGVFNYAFAWKKYQPIPGQKVLNYSVQGGKISYDVETSMTMTHVEGTLSNSEFSIVRHTNSKSGKGGMPMSLKLDGKRTKDCRGGG
jgi:hypothetical protein